MAVFMFQILQYMGVRLILLLEIFYMLPPFRLVDLVSLQQFKD